MAPSLDPIKSKEKPKARQMSTVLKSPEAGREGEQREKLFSKEMPKWSWGAWVEEHELGRTAGIGVYRGHS